MTEDFIIMKAENGFVVRGGGVEVIGGELHAIKKFWVARNSQELAALVKQLVDEPNP